MATGTYGIVRPADVSPEDVEIWVHYTPSRDNAGNTTLFELDATQYLEKVNNPNNTNTNTFEIMGGMYTLRLPVNQFNNKGFYTIYIRPVEIRTKIIDCGVLSALPDIKGIVFDLSQIDSKFVSKFENNALTGYRVEYLSDSTGTGDRKVQNFFRVFTSNNRAEPVNQNLTNTSQKAIRYRFNDNSNLVFCTVSPSAASNVKPNVLPFIGAPDQEVIITNSFFNPIMLEIEMAEHDFDTIATGIFGNHTKSLEDGIYTIYNFNDQIYKQYNLFEIKDRFTGKPLFEVREERDNIDFNKGFDDIANV